MEEQIYNSLPGLLLQWYASAKRDLPWRRDREPYHIWLSEIMLQQTRVGAAIGYYERFLSQLPDLQALAQCPEDKLLKLWEGLGYYNRARNLQKCARVLLQDHGGQFPATAQALQSLPGIGPYTAGAIASIAFGQRAPAIDGNVIRVCTRLLGDDRSANDPQLKKEIYDFLLPLYTPPHCGELTQALMELGALVCLPGSQARCDGCPCRSLCKAFGQDRVAQLPVQPEKKPRRLEERTVFLLQCANAVALCQRQDKGLLASMWQFPNTAGFLDMAQAVDYLQNQGVALENVVKTVEKTHIFTHITWKMRGILFSVTEPSGPYRWMELDQVDATAALPTAFRQFRGEFKEENV